MTKEEILRKIKNDCIIVLYSNRINDDITNYYVIVKDVENKISKEDYVYFKSLSRKYSNIY